MRATIPQRLRIKDQLLEEVRESIARLCGEAEEEGSVSVLQSIAE